MLKNSVVKFLFKYLPTQILLVIIVGLFVYSSCPPKNEESFVTYTVDPKVMDVKFYWKDVNGKIIGSIQNLKNLVESDNRKLTFAMNGGIFMEDFKPLGLFIQEGVLKKKINKADGNGNFYMKPNGIFYLDNDNIPHICETRDFINNGKIKYATQSGPVLLVNGKVRADFKENSTFKNIRNGVGILPDKKVVFVMSKNEVNFYDFAKYFESLGCKNALYLDGAISQTYLPEKNWVQTGGNFGVIIGVTKSKNK